MVASPDVDLVVVCVRVPGHHELVMQALRAGKAVLCEWPLGATVEQAQQMASLAAQNNLLTAVGLQAQSDATLMYARDLVAQGYVGEVLSVVLSHVTQAVTRRGNGRIWQSDKRNGANTLTIAGGHAIDALCYILGEFSEVTARLATRITQWHNTDTGETVAVDSPDWISVLGKLERGAEVSYLVTTVPHSPSGHRLEIYGSEGTLVISGGSSNNGPNHLQGAQRGEPLASLEVPAHFTLVPETIPQGPARNVGQAYARLADPLRGHGQFTPDFAHAVKRHLLIDAIERSSAEGRTIRL
jgi:predicted dehydrogenase